MILGIVHITRHNIINYSLCLVKNSLLIWLYVRNYRCLNTLQFELFGTKFVTERNIAIRHNHNDQIVLLLFLLDSISVYEPSKCRFGLQKTGT